VRLGISVASWVVLLPGLCLAQAEGDEARPRAQVIRAVERGAFAQVELGYSQVVNEVGEVSVGPGASVGAWVGFDVLPVLSLAVGGVAVSAFGTSGEEPGPSSDLFFVSPLARLQLALASSQRDFLWARADGGVAFALPDEIDGESTGGVGPVFGGALAYEHFTKLRHFSIGLSAGALVYLEPDTAVSIQILPLVKYTF